jgi:peptidoglycan/xylan/chitin deacetylase (PgdA/CDA1 family)/outer membrane protein assembly factor BamB
MNEQRGEKIPRQLIMLFFLLNFLLNFFAAQSLTVDQGGTVRGPLDKKLIALVFTADTYGEGGEYILSVLKDRNIKASFFLTGNFLRGKEFEPLVKRMVAEGHYVGPHSDGHLLYCDWDDRSRTLVSKEEFVSDLEKDYAELARFRVDKKDARYFIPPYEWYNQEIADWATETGVILVNFTSGTASNDDYTTPDMPGYLSSEEIYRRILGYESSEPSGLNGFILLLHLGTAPERTDKFYHRLGELVDELGSRGYSFVRIDGLLSGKGKASVSEAKKASTEAQIQRETKSARAQTEQPLTLNRPAKTEIELIQAETSPAHDENRLTQTEARPIKVDEKPGLEFFELFLTEFWAVDSPGKIVELGAMGNVVFWATEEAQVYFANAQNGHINKVINLDAQLSLPPASGRHGFWLTSGTRILCLNENGDSVFDLCLPEELIRPPLEDSGQLLLLYKDSLEARDASSGGLFWKFGLSAELSGLLTITGSSIFIPSSNGTVIRLKRKTGEKMGQYDFKEAITSIISPDGKRLFLGVASGKVLCFDPGKQKIRWQVNVGSQRIEQLLAHGRYLYVLTSGGVLYALRQSGGDIDRWQIIPGRVFFQPHIFQDEIIVPSSSGALPGFDLKTGKKASETPLAFEIKTDLITAGDLLLAGVYDFRNDRSLVYALKKEPQVIIKPFKDSPQRAGQRIVFMVQSSGFNKPRYEFYLRRADGQERLVRKASNKNTWTWFPVQEGEYVITARAFDKKLSKKTELRYNIASFVKENDIRKE